MRLLFAHNKPWVHGARRGILYRSLLVVVEHISTYLNNQKCVQKPRDSGTCSTHSHDVRNMFGVCAPISKQTKDFANRIQKRLFDINPGHGEKNKNVKTTLHYSLVFIV